MGISQELTLLVQGEGHGPRLAKGSRRKGRWLLFTVRDQVENGQGGPVAAAAALSLDLVLREAPSRVVAWKRRIASRFERLDLARDLGADIGSLHWFRGLGTMLGLGVAALSFWPDLTAVEAATMRDADSGVRDEYRSQMIMPLGLGGDSGRRMGATALVRPLAGVPERPTLRLTATLAQGDSFGRMLQRAGVGAGDAARASELIAGAVPLGQIASGTRVDITLGARGADGAPRPLAKLEFRAGFDLELGLERHGDALALEKRPIAVSVAPLRIQGTVGAGLYRAARAAGAPVKAIQDYLRTLGGHVSLAGDVAPTDRFDMIVAYKRSAAGEGQVGDLLYAGLDRGGRPAVELMRWGKEGQFYEASGLGAAQRTVEVTTGGVRMASPVNGRMTSGYGLRRHPILGYARMHAGIDFGAAWGSPIFATADGVVSYAGRHGGHGNYVRLDHGGGLGTGYGHMSRIAVAPGAHVRAGQVIGYVGSTGLSTGPHLHYEVYRGGRTVNPLSMPMGGFTTTTTVAVSRIDSKELSAFKARLAELKAVRPGA